MIGRRIQTWAAILAAILWQGPVSAQSCTGCSCKGGPGYRLTTGKCVSWAQHEKFKGIGKFPAGASCEHPEGCTLETTKGVNRLSRGETKAGQ